MDRKLKEIIPNLWKKGLTRAKNAPIITLLFLLLLAVVQPLWHGYQFGVSDHSIQFSIMNRIMDETLYPNDPMLDTARGYVSFFPRFMVVLIRIARNMEALYFVLHVLSYFFYFTALYYISMLLFDRISATLCVILMSTGKIVLGGSSIHFTGLYPSFFTLPLVLLAIYLFLRERYSIAYAIIGIALNLHVLSAGYTFCMFACHSLLRLILPNLSTSKANFESVSGNVASSSGKPCRDGGATLRDMIFQTPSERWAGLRELAKHLGIFALCASPALVWILSTHGSMSDEWVRLLRIRSSHHSFPLAWAKSHYVNYLLLLATGALAFLYAPRAKFHLKILTFVLAIAFMCLAGVIFAEYHPVKLVLRGQLFRSTNFLTIFCVIYVSNYIRRSWANTILHKVGMGIIFISLFLSPYFNFLILGLILCLIADNIFSISKETSATVKTTVKSVASTFGGQRLSKRLWFVCRHVKANKISIFVLMAILVRNFAPHDSFPSSFNLNGIISLINTFFENRLLFIIICSTIMLTLLGNLKNVCRSLGILLIASLLAVYVVPSAYRRFHPENRYRESWRDVQIWAKENTPKDALFLTPPNNTGFRIFSQRPIVGEWKDGTQQYFDADYSYEWWRRMQDLRSSDWANMGEKRYVELAKKYGASYLVLPAKVSLNLRKEYENGGYSVYQFE